MAKFRKRPVIVDAIKFTYPPTEEVLRFCGEGLRNVVKARHPYAVGQADVTTVHGETAVVREGDWIIRDAKPGTFYPCKNDVFERTYEPWPDSST